MNIGFYGALLGARMEIFKGQILGMESAFSVALCNERMTLQYDYLCYAYGKKWLKMSTDLFLVANNQPDKS